jgi:hypothetical protein
MAILPPRGLCCGEPPMRTTPRRRWRATYDPLVLRALKVYGFKADPVMARVWYEKARELGSAAAPRRLEMLTSGMR